jgi:hypothetical protein
MRDEDPLDRQLEEGPQRRLEVVESRRSDPTGRAEAQRLVGRARLGAGAEQDVADDECALRRDLVDDSPSRAVPKHRTPPASSSPS